MAGAYPGFRCMKRLRVLISPPPPPPLDGMLVYRSVTPIIKVVGTHLCTWVERGTVRVKCLAQEHNIMSRDRARTRTARSGEELTGRGDNAPPPEVWISDTIRHDNFIYTRYFHQLIKLIIYSNVSIYLTTLKFITNNSNKNK